MWSNIATSGDPFEAGSARPLDFGHWVAHKLEQVSSFAVGHGEAVAIGMAVDLLYSREIGMLDGETVERVLKLIEGCEGSSSYSEWLESEEGGKHVILRGLEEFREHLGGRLTITLVPEIGKKTEVHENGRGEGEGGVGGFERACEKPVWRLTRGPVLWSVFGVEMKRVAVINVVGLTRGLVGGRAPRLAAVFLRRVACVGCGRYCRR